MSVSSGAETQAVLHQQEEQFKALVSNLPGAVYRCAYGTVWSIEFISDRIFDLTGYPATAFISKQVRSFKSITHPDDQARVEEVIQTSLKQKQSYEVEYRFIRSDRTICWVYEKGQAIYAANGTILWLDGVISDITDRKQSEAALRKSERKLSLHLQQTALAVVEWNLDLAVTEWNLAAERIFGYRREEAVGRSAIGFLISTEDKRTVGQFWHNLLKQRDSLPSTFKNLTKSGKTIVCDWYSTPLVDDDGNVVGVASLIQDTTEQRRSNEALRRSETKNRALLKAIPDLILQIDCLGTFLDMIPAKGFETLLVDREWLGKNIYEVMPQDSAQQCMEYVERVLETGETQVYEYQLTVEDRLNDYEARLVMSGEQDVLMIVRDITEAKRHEADRKQAEMALKRAEEKYRSIVENAVEGIFQTTPDGRYLVANTMLARIYGYESPVDLMEAIEDIQHQLYVQDDRRLEFIQQMRDYGIIRNFESEVYRKDGSIIWISENAHAVIDDDGEVLIYEGTVEDITLQKRAEMIRKSAELLQVILDNIPQYIFWKDRNYRYLGCNRAYAETVGIGTAEQLIGKTDYELPVFTQVQAEYAQMYAQRVMECDQAELHIVELQPNVEGKEVWVDRNRIPIHDGQGQVIGILNTMEDITDRKFAEEALQQSEAQSRQLAQREALLNRLSGQIRNSLDLDTILSTTVHEIRNLLEVHQCNFLWYSIEGDQPRLSLSHEACHGNCPSYEQVAPIPQLNDPYIRALQQGELIQIDDLRHDNFLGVETRAHMLAKGYISLLVCPIKTHSGRLGIINCIYRDERREWSDREVDLLQAVGNQLAIALDQAELYEQSRTAALTAQAQAEQIQQTLQELQRTQAHLIQTEKMSSLGQLVAGVAHEINNPVNFIYGNLSHAHNYARDLLDLVALYQTTYAQPTPEIKTQLKAIDLEFIANDLPQILSSMSAGTDRIRQIVLSLRNFSRLDESAMKRVNIHEGIDSTLLILQSRLKTNTSHANVEVVKNYGDLPKVECYAGQLNQVFMNILSNAIDALEDQPAPRIITISTELVQEPQTQTSTNTIPEPGSEDSTPPTSVVIRIHDNGPGMSELVSSKLFDPFFTTKSVGKGTGLGLSVSYHIVVEKHGGLLKCNSRPSEGAEFYIQIPTAPVR